MGSGGPPPSSLTLFTDLGVITSYLRNYMTDFQNPQFHTYTLDGDGFYINDGEGDMYDDGNATTPWLLSNQTYTGNTSYSSGNYPHAVNYQTTGTTGVQDTTFGYLSLGYDSPNLLPLTVFGTRAINANPGDPIGFQTGGNSGADGSGTVIDGHIYSGNTVSGFTVHSYYREIYGSGDPSTCDVYILLGHPDWNSVFGDVYYGADLDSTNGNGSFFYTSGGGAQNVLAIKTLLSKYDGSEVTFSEINTIVDNFIMRIGESQVPAPTPTQTPTSSLTPTPTPSPLPLSQFTPNGTPGTNGLLTYLNYTNGVDSGNNILLPDSSTFNHPYVWTGTNPYNVGTTGYTFNGTGNYAYAQDASNYNLGFNQMSFEMWVKIPSIPGSMSLIAAGGNNSGGWALRLDSSGNALNLVKYNVADQSVSLPSTLQADTWYHIAALQGGTSLTFMINGVIVGAINDAATNNFSFPSGTVNIAKDYYTSTNYAMTLGYLKVYDYCLNASDVTTEFNDTKAGYGFAVDVTPTPTPSATSAVTPTPTLTPSSTMDVTPTPTPTPSVGAGAGVGSWYFYSDEGNINAQPPNANGNAIFTIQGSPVVETFNPNKASGTTFIHFCVKDSVGTDYTSQFSGFTGGTGTITISQNGDTATYTSTTPGSFGITNAGGGFNFFIISTAACTQTKSSNATYVYGDPISITFGS